MARPAAGEWAVLDRDDDPVPGRVEDIETIAAAYHDLAATTREAHGLLVSGSEIEGGQGQAMEAFRDLIGKLPGRLDQMATSYARAADTMLRYVPSLEEAQTMSLRALDQARLASQDRGAADAAVGLARTALSAATDAGDGEAADGARLDQADAQRRLDDAQAVLDQARALLGQATALRDQAARTTARVLGDLAGDAPQRSIWEKMAEAFHAFVDFLTSTVVEWITLALDAIATVAGMIFPPLGAAIGFLSGALDVLAALASGDGLAIGLAVGGLALGLVPGGRLAARIGKLVGKAGKAAPGTVKAGIADAAGALGRGDPGSVKVAGSFDGPPGSASGLGKANDVPARSSRPDDLLVTCGDPVDVATGRMVMTQVDVDLPGLRLVRSHRTGYRSGRSFGPGWSSTLDQRLELDGDRVHLAGEDGMILTWRRPGPGERVRPEVGVGWVLEAGPDGHRVGDPATGRMLLFAPADGDTRPLTAILDGPHEQVVIDRDAEGTPVEVRAATGARLVVESAGGLISALRLVGEEGAVPGGTGDDGSVTVRRYRYDGEGRLIAVVDADGRAVRFELDSRGRVVRWESSTGMWYRYTFDERDRCVRGEGRDGYLDYRYAYRDATATTPGLTRVTDSLGHTRTYHLDEHLQVVAETDPLGATTTSVWGEHHRLLARTDPLGRTTRFGYDDGGRLRSVTRPDGSAVAVSEGAGELRIEVAAADGTRWRRAYAGEARPDPFVDPLGVGGEVDVEELAGRPAGPPVPAGAARGDALGRVAAVVDALGGETRLGWTLDGAPAWRETARGRERWRYDGDGNQIEHRDAAGAVTRIEPGPFGLPAAVTTPDGGRTAYGWDTELRLTSLTDAAGRRWSWRYDAAGRVVEETDFDGRVLRVERDAAGRPARKVLPSGEVVEYRHDELGNLTGRRDAGGATAFGYDPAGRLLVAVGPETTLRIERDADGRVLSETVDGRTTRIDHDGDGTVAGRRPPSGMTSRWVRDGEGRPVELAAGGRHQRLDHDAAGRLTSRSMPEGFGLRQAFDADHDLAGQELLAGAATTARRHIERRADGLPVATHEPGADRRYTLDGAGRITAVNGPGWAERYRYDATGAPVTAVVARQEGGDARPGSGPGAAPAVTYQRDGLGRVVLRTESHGGDSRSWRLRWGPDDRLVGVTTPEGEDWRYRYDPLGRRIAKQRFGPDGVTVVDETWFAWDGPLLVEARNVGADRTVTWEHDPDTDHPIAQIERSGGDPPRYLAVVTDALGRPTELVEPDGTVAWRARATVWGRTAPASGATATTPLRFPGQYHDDETGLHYNVMRYYDPDTGRYLSQDLLGVAAGPDPCAYVANPLVAADPLGLAPKKPDADCTTGKGKGGGRSVPTPSLGAIDVGVGRVLRRARQVDYVGRSQPRFQPQPNFTSLPGGGKQVTMTLGKDTPTRYNPVDQAERDRLHLLPATDASGSNYEWIQGHILNGKAGGTGTAPNLTPLTKSANTSMTKVENAVNNTLQRYHGFTKFNSGEYSVHFDARAVGQRPESRPGIQVHDHIEFNVHHERHVGGRATAIDQADFGKLPVLPPHGTRMNTITGEFTDVHGNPSDPRTWQDASWQEHVNRVGGPPPAPGSSAPPPAGSVPGSQSQPDMPAPSFPLPYTPGVAGPSHPPPPGGPLPGGTHTAGSSPLSSPPGSPLPDPMDID